MNKKQITRLLCFLVLVALTLGLLCGLFEYPNSHMSERFETYQNLDKNTVDAVYIGTSGVDRFWIGAKAYNDYGMTVYPLSVDALPSWLVLNTVKQAFKGQEPKLIIVDVRSFAWDPSGSVETAEKRSRRLIDQLDFVSLNRFSAIHRSLSLINRIDPTVSKYDLSFYLPFIRYHDMWDTEDFSFDEIGRDESETMGFYIHKTKSVRSTQIKTSSYSSKSEELNEYSAENLRELLKYLKENGIDALFVSSPRYTTDELSESYNGIFDIIEEEGFPYLNFNCEENAEKYPMDFDRDYYDNGHVNFFGAEKYTEYFSEYLHENYEFTDRREGDGLEGWAKAWQNINKTMDKLSKK